MQPFSLEKPVAHSKASKFSAVLIGRIVSRYIYNSVVLQAVSHRMTLRNPPGSRLPLLSAVGLSSCFGNKGKRSTVKPAFHDTDILARIVSVGVGVGVVKCGLYATPATAKSQRKLSAKLSNTWINHDKSRLRTSLNDTELTSHYNSY